MSNELENRAKAVGILFLVTVALILIQMSPLAPLPRTVNDFLKGVAVGLAIIMVIIQLKLRRGKPKS